MFWFSCHLSQWCYSCFQVCTWPLGHWTSSCWAAEAPGLQEVGCEHGAWLELHHNGARILATKVRPRYQKNDDVRWALKPRKAKEKKKVTAMSSEHFQPKGGEHQTCSFNIQVCWRNAWDFLVILHIWATECDSELCMPKNCGVNGCSCKCVLLWRA